MYLSGHIPTNGSDEPKASGCECNYRVLPTEDLRVQGQTSQWASERPSLPRWAELHGQLSLLVSSASQTRFS